jgi:hypothetical protein
MKSCTHTDATEKESGPHLFHALEEYIGGKRGSNMNPRQDLLYDALVTAGQEDQLNC